MPLRDAPRELDFPKPEPVSKSATPTLTELYTQIGKEFQELNFIVVARMNTIKRLLETAETTAKQNTIDQGAV